MPARIWLDITGIRPGSDAAIFATCLGAALRAERGEQVQLCRRDPGLRALSWSDLAGDLGRRRRRGWRGPPLLGLRRLARRLPDRGRAATGRFLRLQRTALFAWKRAVLLSLKNFGDAGFRDRITPSSGDTLVMLTPSGDAARFAVSGTRLAFVAADAMALTRPDLMTADDAMQAAIWLRSTLPHVSAVVAFSQSVAHSMAQAGSLPSPVHIDAAPSLVPILRRQKATSPGFVLAAGTIGEAGRTRQLLLVWRSLLDDPPAGGVPILMLAGDIGALVGDMLEQLRNSRLFDGHVRLLATPTPEQMSDLLRTCRFCISPTAAPNWGRAAWDSLAAGVPCLSDSHVADAVAVDCGDAASVGRAVRAWLAEPPYANQASGPRHRNWIDVARELLQALAI